MKIGTAAAVVAAAAGIGGYIGLQPSPAQPAAPAPAQTVTVTAPAPTPELTFSRRTSGTGTEPLRYVAATWTVWDGLLNEFQKTYPQGGTTELWDNKLIHVKGIASDGKGWDVGAMATTNARPLIRSDVIQPIDVDRIPNWREAWDSGLIADPVGPKIIEEPGSVLPYQDGILDRLTSSHIWGVGFEGTEGQKGTQVNKYSRYLPVILNAESMGFNPEFVPFDQLDEVTFGLNFDREYKGRVAFQDEYIITTVETAKWLFQTGQWEPKYSDYTWDLDVRDLEFLIGFLIDNIEAGQFRGYWTEFGEAVEFFVSREVYLSNVWQPVVQFTRANGVPAYYATLKEGYDWWYGGDFYAQDTDKWDLAHQWTNLRLSGFWTGNIFDIFGYSTPTSNMPEAKESMGPEKYGWTYQKAATYKPIEEIIPDQDERIARALFNPGEYEWSTEEGQPHTRGAFIDRLGYPEWIKRCTSFLGWLENGDIYAELWLRTFPPR